MFAEASETLFYHGFTSDSVVIIVLRHLHYGRSKSGKWRPGEQVAMETEHAKEMKRWGEGTKETGSRNATAISENCYQPELKTCY
jgi:hypothetical protein